MRQEVGRKINITPGEVQRYFEEHKQEYAQPESVKLSEILISTGSTGSGGLGDDPRKGSGCASQGQRYRSEAARGRRL